jgi:hypothetical protein
MAAAPETQIAVRVETSLKKQAERIALDLLKDDERRFGMMDCVRSRPAWATSS